MSLLSLSLFLPLIGFFLSLPFSQRLARLVAAFFGGLNLTVVLALLFQGPQETTLPPLLGYPLVLEGNLLCLPFLALTRAVTLLNLLDRTTSPRLHLACVFAADFALSGTLLALDGIGQVFFWALSLFPITLLIGIWGRGEREFAARKFFLFQMAAAGGLLVAVVAPLIAHRTQVGLDSALPGDLAKVTLAGEPFAVLLFLACLVRSAVFPAHRWLTEAFQSAPLPGKLFLACGFLPGGLLTLARLGPEIYGEELAPAQLALACLLLAGLWYTMLLALGRDWLAYFLSGQGALTFLAVLMGTEKGTTGALYHLFAQAMLVCGLLLLPKRRLVLPLFFFPGYAGLAVLLSSILGVNLSWAVAAAGGWFVGAIALMKESRGD